MLGLSMKSFEDYGCLQQAQLRQKIDCQISGCSRPDEHTWELVFDLAENQIYVEHSWRHVSNWPETKYERLEINDYLKRSDSDVNQLRDMLVAVFWQ